MRNFTFVIVAVLGLAIWVKTRNARPADPATAAKQTSATTDANGWTAVPMPAGVDAKRVLVFSALNCPKAESQRALAIVDQLGTQGVPCVHTDRISFPTATPQEGARLNTVMSVAGRSYS
jgi:hypothetical protein